MEILVDQNETLWKENKKSTIERMTLESSCHVIQNTFRRKRLHRLTEMTREKITCSVCMEPGESLLCQNGHPICPLCLHVRCITRHHECCVCRDDKGFHTSPFLRQAVEMGLKWKCSDCERRVCVDEVIEHRLVCEHRELVCPVECCNRRVKKCDLICHVLQHSDTDFHECHHQSIALVHMGGSGEAIIVWQYHDVIVQFQFNAQQDSLSSGGWYALHVNGYGKPLRLRLDSYDPLSGELREVTYVNIVPDVTSHSGIGFCPVQARIQSSATLSSQDMLEWSSRPTRSATLPTEPDENANIVTWLQRKKLLPTASQMQRPTGNAYDTMIVSRLRNILVLGVTLLP